MQRDRLYSQGIVEEPLKDILFFWQPQTPVTTPNPIFFLSLVFSF